MQISLQRCGSSHQTYAEVSSDGFRQWGAPVEELGKNVGILEAVCQYLSDHPEDGDEVQP